MHLMNDAEHMKSFSPAGRVSAFHSARQGTF